MSFAKKMIYPEFYYDFECKAGACLHTCCRGWEIDIDEATAQWYMELPGGLGDKLRSVIDREDGFSFRLTKDERCPMLREDGLCEIILEKGEDALCDICHLHPRFFLEYEGCEMSGLGLSCERVTELVLSYTERIQYINGSDIVPKVDFSPFVISDYYSDILEIFGETEPIDEKWTSEIGEMRQDLPKILKLAQWYQKDYSPIVFSNLMTYILYRQLELVPERGIELMTDYAQLCCDFIYMRAAYTGDLAESVRRFSEQIEYSTENVSIILDTL